MVTSGAPTIPARGSASALARRRAKLQSCGMRRLLPLLVLLVFLPACGAVTAPPSLTAAERAPLAAARLDLTLGVGQHPASWPREGLVAALAQRRLFPRRDRPEAVAEPPHPLAARPGLGH